MQKSMLLLLALGAVALVVYVALTQGAGSGPSSPGPPQRDSTGKPDEPVVPPGVTGDPGIALPADPPEPSVGDAVLLVEVVDDAGSPVADAEVDLEFPLRKEGAREARTDSEGRCRFADLPVGGRVTVTARGAPPLTSASKTVKLDSEPMTLTLSLEEGGSVAGTVVDENGSPLAVAHVVQLDIETDRMVLLHRDAGRTIGRAGQGYRTLRQPPGEPRFELTGISPGKYVVRVSAEGYEPGRSETFEVQKGESATGIDVVMTRGGSVSGVVVRGRTGAPVEGARVSLVPAGSFSFDSFIGGSGGVRIAGQQTVETDGQGRFRIDSVKPGTYGLIATAEDSSPGRVSEVVVERDRETGGVFLSLGEGGAVTGTVYGSDGMPEAKAVVLVSKVDPRITIMGDFGQRVETDESGVYFLDHLEPGQYRVRRPQGGTSMAVSMRVSVSGSSEQDAPPREPAEDEVTVREGQVTRHDLHSSRSCTVLVRVTDGDGKPLEKMVSLRSLRDPPTDLRAGPSLTIPVTGMTNKRGEHEFKGVEPGPYEAVVEGMREPVDVAPGRRVVVEIRVLTSTVEGRILDENGKPIEGATVLLQPVRDPGSGVFAFFSPTGRRSTDEKGRFRFTDVSPGKFRVQAVEGKRTGGSEEFDVAPGERIGGIEARLESPVSVGFLILDSAGLPVPNALLTLAPTSRTRSSWGRPRTDARGRAEAQLAPGEYRVFVQTGQDPREAEPATITVGRGDGQTFTLRAD